MLLLALIAPSMAADFLQTDAAAPGMAVQVNILREAGGFDGTELVTTDCADIVVGPVSALDRAADPDAPISGAVLSTAFYVASDATTGVDCSVFIDGVALSAFNDGIDNLFSIVEAAAAPVDGGTGDADGVADGVITIAATDRTDGGTLVLDSLFLEEDVILWFDTTDPLSDSEGNEAFLPVILLVQGDATVAGIISMEGQDGDDAPSGLAADGGDGAPGGGGGGVGSNCYGPAFLAGDGFTGGGGTAAGTCIDFGYGGTGAGEGPDLEHGGEGIFTDVENGALGYAGGTGGGTGVPWGTGGIGGYCCGSAGEGGFGGGGGNGHSEASGWGAGGGGFGTDGENGMGVVGGGATDSYRVGGAGLTSLHDTLVPMAGGSGGAGGDSGSGTADGGAGGGGGGAFLLSARNLVFEGAGAIAAWGGDGGDTVGTNPGSSVGGAGGSGGGVHLAAWSISGLSADQIDVHGGYGGTESTGDYSGDGGEGRLRVDGSAPPTLDEGPTGYAAPTWQGAAFASIDDTDLTITSSGPVTLYIYGSDGTEVAAISMDEDGSETLFPYLGTTADQYLLVLVDDTTGTMSPAGVASLGFDPDQDDDGSIAERYDGDDCDDDDGDINPDADELCDGIDNDCDGTVDEDDAVDAGTWYTDSDGDGYGDTDSVATSCEPAGDQVSVPGDCDDDDGAVNPDATEVCDGIDNDCDGTVDEDDASDAATWYADSDGDGWGDEDSSTLACEDPGDGWVAEAGDCDDEEAAAYPTNTEICDDIDNDCDGAVDEDDAADAATWYADSDGDGWGDEDSTTLACEDPGDGWVAEAGDCDDEEAAAYPTNTEICDDIDNDCDGAVDEDDAADAATWYADSDGDGWGDEDSTTLACEDPGDGWVAEAGDCDDGEAAAYPTNTEICDDIDNDCDGFVDEGDAADAATWYADSDGDGWGDADSSTTACEDPGDDWVAEAGDCDDEEAAAYPTNTEICDDIDNDCDGVIDEDDAADATTWYADGDGDGWGVEGTTAMACEDPGDGWVEDAGDCDDTDTAYHPGAEESDCSDPNDYNCDGSVAYDDLDADGWAACEECDDSDAAINPGAEEICNGIDDDCDGAVDEKVTSTWYTDADEDGFGDRGAPVEDCTQPDGTTEDDTDCDDTDGTIYPGAEEIPDDGIDQDCDGEDDVTPEDTGDGGATDGGTETTDGGTTDGGTELDDSGKVIGGCGGCATGRGAGGGFMALGLGLLGLLRRRRGER